MASFIEASLRHARFYLEALSCLGASYADADPDFAWDRWYDSLDSNIEGAVRFCSSMLENAEARNLAVGYASTSFPLLDSVLSTSKYTAWQEQAVLVCRKDGNNEGLIKHLGLLANVQINLGRLSSALLTAHEALAVEPVTNRQVRWRALVNAGIATNYLGQPTNAVPPIEEAISLLKGTPENRHLTIAYSALADALINQGEAHRGAAAARLSACAARHVDDLGGEVLALNFLGNALTNLGRLQVAEKAYVACLTLSRALKYRRAEGDALGNLGMLAFDHGDYENAIRLSQESLLIREVIGDLRGASQNHGNIGISYAALKLYDQAETHHLTALEMSREMDDRRGIAQDLGNLGEVYVETDRFDAAAEVLAESLQLLQALGDKRSEAISQAAIGDLHRKRGELTEADFAYSRAIELARASQDPIAAGEIQWRLCGLLTSMGCAAEARHLAETILDTLRPVDHRLTSEIEAFLFTTPPA